MIGRARTIQPGTFTDAILWDAGQSTGLPLLQGFEGLWCYSDKEGRFEWKPRELKLVILPFWDGKFEDVLSALVAHGFVVPYEVLGRQYGLVRNFKKHQQINGRESPSRLPPVPRGTCQTHDNDTSTTRHGQDLTRLSLSGFEDVSDPDPDRASVSGSDLELTGSAREDEKKSPFRTENERRAFELWETKVWKKLHPEGAARATPKRVTPIRARLREGATLEQFSRACDAVAASTWHLGENDSGKAYIEPQTLFRNREKFEEWLTVRAAKAPGAIEHEKQQAAENARLIEQARRGEYGERTQRLAAEGRLSGDLLKRFKEAVRTGNLKRRVPEPPRPSEPVSSPRATDAPPVPPGAVANLLGGIGRSIP